MRREGGDQIKIKWTVKDRREPLHYKPSVHSVYWRQMRRAIFSLLMMCFVLAVTCVFGQPESCLPASCSTGILEPGGSYTGVDGVTLDASRSHLNKPLEVFIERLSESQLPKPLDAGMKAETGFYRVGATTRFATYSDRPTILRIPIPEGAITENLALLAWSKAEDILDYDPSLGDFWNGAPISYDPQKREVAFSVGNLDPQGLIYVVVSGRYGSTLNPK
jgi:hypothetical protein